GRSGTSGDLLVVGANSGDASYTGSVFKVLNDGVVVNNVTNYGGGSLNTDALNMTGSQRLLQFRGTGSVYSDSSLLFNITNGGNTSNVRWAIGTDSSRHLFTITSSNSSQAPVSLFRVQDRGTDRFTVHGASGSI